MNPFRSSLYICMVSIVLLCLWGVLINTNVTTISSSSYHSKINGTTDGAAHISIDGTSSLTPPTAPALPTCRRPCPSGPRHNKIVYHNWLPTGLNDRLRVITGLTNLAGWLCAVVEFPPPYYALAQKHNYQHPQPSAADNEEELKQQQPQQRISKDLQWNDFINLTFLPDGTVPSLIDLDLAHGMIPRIDTDRGKLSVPPSRLRFYQGGPYRDWNLITTKDSSTMIQDVHLLNDIVQRQLQQAGVMPNRFTSSNNTNTNITEPYFVWTIKTNWYHTLPSLQGWLEGKRQLSTNMTSSTDFSTSSPALSKNGPGCQYVQRMRPTYQIELVDQVLQQAYPAAEASSSSTTTTTTRTTTTTSRSSTNKDLLGFLHIRRGDPQSQEECNTELDRVQRYIDCSFSGNDQEGMTRRRDTPPQQRQHSSPSPSSTELVNIALLFASDEQNVTYRNTIRTMILRQQQKYNNKNITTTTTSNNNNNVHLNIKFVDLDHLLWQLVDQYIQKGRIPQRLANNFVIFEMESILQWEYSNFRLQQRRTIACHDCDNGWINQFITSF